MLSKMLIGAVLALTALSPPALAQEAKPKHTANNAIRETLDASMARLAMKAAFQPSVQPTRQELFGVILLMSLREQRGSGT
jgi:hypothetical protein